ncbi:hypothetical protein PTTG_06221, partial [Puccinia triticina 1-1 BBBD Race 1]
AFLTPSRKWQRHKQIGIDCKFHLDKFDLDLARDLLEILSIFYEITLQILISGSACLSNIVVFIDQITKHLSTAISGSKYPPALKNACQIGLKIMNKYYSLTDNSPLYRIAIILHPLFRDKYFKLLRWEPEWIAEAIRLARKMWVKFYKPDPTPPNPSTSLTKTSKWWIQQKNSGNMHGGLVYMVLDVLSFPATLVDVKRAFSFGRNYFLPRRHRLSARSLSRGMTVAFYSKNGMIKDGVLAKWKHGLQTEKKVKAKEKGKKKVIVVDED